MADFTTVLVNSQSPDAAIRAAAEGQISAFEASNFAAFVGMLITELATETRPANVRQLAGVILKNALDAKTDERLAELEERWKVLDAGVKGHVKAGALSVLGSESKEARSIAAQIISKIAVFELPQKTWTDLMALLLHSVTSPESSAVKKEASLMTLGYICEEVDPDCLNDHANNILTAIIQGMREPNMEIRLVATKALNNALEFVKSNFENETERNFIMTCICEACVCSSEPVREAAFEVLGGIADLYYKFIGSYMHAIFQLTLGAIKSDVEKVAMQAVEFWSTLADCEFEIIQEAQEAAQYEETPERICLNISAGALPHIVPALLESMTKQEDEQDSDTWNLSSAATTCLSLFAEVAGDAAVDQVLPFVQAHIQSPDWHYKEAAVMAFGSVLSGPTEAKLLPIVEVALPVLVLHIKDSVALVRDTASWTLGRIAEMLPEFVADPKYIDSILGVLLQALAPGQDAKVSSNACWAISNICGYFTDILDDETDTTSPMSRFAGILLQALFVVAEREDASEDGLRISAFECMAAVLQSCAQDMKPMINALIPAVLERLNRSISTPTLNMEEREEQYQIQAQLCGSINIAFRKLGADAKPQATRAMELLLRLLSVRTASVQEEGLMAVGSIAECLGADFLPFMDHFIPFLEVGLSNFAETDVCAMAVNTTCVLGTALEANLAPYCDRIMSHFIRDLSEASLHRTVKRAIIGAFGDIALAIGDKFTPYLAHVAPVLQQAGAIEAPKGDDEMKEYVAELRVSICEAYTGILQGLKDTQKAAMAVCVDPLIALLSKIASEKKPPIDVLKAVIAVIGDLVEVYGKDVKPIITKLPFSKLLDDGAKSKDQGLKETALWVRKLLTEC